MKPDDFVIATRSINGIFKNSVGIINSICEKGRFKDNIAILETAIEYLKRFEDSESEDPDATQ